MYTTRRRIAQLTAVCALTLSVAASTAGAASAHSTMPPCATPSFCTLTS